MFTQKCFIRKNTPELVKKLEELGYKVSFSARNGYGKYLYAFYGTVLSVEYDAYDERAGFIDCKESEELFLAIASLRDDTDMYQWLTDGDNYFYRGDGDCYIPFKSVPKLHKATVQELIEHFKP